jgi:hydroxyacylglutathione hydrolase
MKFTQLMITGIPALKDNYIWMIRKSGHDQVIIVDPGEEKAVIDTIELLKVKLSGILVTHHHWDHTNGVPGLQEKYHMPVFWAKDRKPDEEISFSDLGLSFRVIKIPGHTLDHVAYYGHDSLFCGDTLFTAGCGRIFEGAAPQMYESLHKLTELPDNTQIYCGHEYTRANLRFAKLIEPENIDLLERIKEVDDLRAQNFPTVPALLSLEKKTNPFLRAHIPAVIQAVQKHTGQNISGASKIFEALRNWKNSDGEQL